MELTQIKYFKTTAELQHITKAAEILHIAQPALTKSIHKLEHELGVPLFAPKGRNIALTEYGKYLYERIIEPLNVFETLPSEIKMLADQNRSTVRLNVLAASTFVTQCIIEYQRKNPNVSFSVVQNEKTDLWDVSIGNYNKNDEKTHGSSITVTERIMLAVPENSKWTDKKGVILSELGSEGFISLAGTRRFRMLCDDFCRKAGFVPNVIFESDNYAAVQNFIASGNGIGFWPEHTWGTTVNGVKLLPVISPECSREIIIAKNSDRLYDEQSAVNDFYEFLTTRFKSIV